MPPQSLTDRTIVDVSSLRVKLGHSLHGWDRPIGEVDEMLTFVFTVIGETLTLRQDGSTLVFTLAKQPVG